nr:hypothetical protein [Fodinicola feengrottensis]
MPPCTAIVVVAPRQVSFHWVVPVLVSTANRPSKTPPPSPCAPPKTVGPTTTSSVTPENWLPLGDWIGRLFQVVSAPVLASTAPIAFSLLPLRCGKSPPTMTRLPSELSASVRTVSSAAGAHGSNAPVARSNAASRVLVCPSTWVKSPPM